MVHHRFDPCSLFATVVRGGPIPRRCLVLVGALLFATAGRSAHAADPPDAPPVVVILDASGSMAKRVRGQRKMVLARQALADLVDGLAVWGDAASPPELAMLLERPQDEVWATVAPEVTVLQRLEERSGLAEAESLARIHSQMSDDERVKQADVVIDTDCPLEQLKAKIKELWRRPQAGESA